MITSYKLVVNPIDFRLVLVVIASNQDEVDSILEGSIFGNYDVVDIQRRVWYGFDAFHLLIGSSDFNSLVMKWPPKKPIYDTDWDYKSLLK